MKKFFKLIFNRMTATILAFILQIVAICFVIWLIKPWYALFSFVCSIIALFVFFSIIDEKEPAEYKIPWILLLLFLPIFGIITFLLYARPKLSEKSVGLMYDCINEARSCIPIKDMKEFDKKNEYSEYYGQCKYLQDNCESYGSYNNKMTFLKNGESFFEDLKEQLKKAEKFIFIQFFIIHKGIMWQGIKDILVEKAKSGVEVRVMYDDMGSIDNDQEFCQELNNQGIECVPFNKLGFSTSGRHNNRDHRKIVVIDGVVAFTGGSNVGDEYINAKKKFGLWKDSAIRMEGEVAKEFCLAFLLLNDLARGKKSEYKKYLLSNPQSFNEEGYVQPVFHGPKPIYTERVAETNYINLINSAKEHLYITTPYLICDYELLSAIRHCAMRGVDVRLITPHIPDKKLVFNVTRSHYKYLYDGGVKIYEFTPGFIHAKEMMVDGKSAFIGTVNLDYRSLVHHFECGVTMFKTPCITDMENDFNETLKICEEVNPYKLKNNPFKWLITSIISIFSPLL